jgi:uncharacterized membrane protein YsdA (DUF1294 family)
LVFGYDKNAARKSKNRIPERNLFILTLLGGTIGGLVAMKTFNHKTRKTSFIFTFYGIVLLQLFVLYLLFKNRYF